MHYSILEKLLQIESFLKRKITINQSSWDPVVTWVDCSPADISHSVAFMINSNFIFHKRDLSLVFSPLILGFTKSKLSQCWDSVLLSYPKRNMLVKFLFFWHLSHKRFSRKLLSENLVAFSWAFSLWFLLLCNSYLYCRMSAVFPAPLRSLILAVFGTVSHISVWVDLQIF